MTELEKKEIERKKEYLNSYKKKARKLKSLREQEQTFRIGIENPKAIIYSDMPSSHNQRDQSDNMVELEKVQQKIIKKIDEIIKLRTNIEDKIADMEDGIESDIIRKRYLEFKEWTEISIEIGYCWKQTHRKHSQALKNINI